MKFAVSFLLLPLLFPFSVKAQTTETPSFPEGALAQKVTITGFCLCKASLIDLKKLPNLQKVEVEEMDSPKGCFGQDARYENNQGYYSTAQPGIIFQKDTRTEYVSKIRLTKDFKGNLPDGKFIDLRQLTLKDVITLYPRLANTWFSRGCSNYWRFSNDTLSFFVKIDSTKKPQFPINKEYYYPKPVEAIDLVLSCYSVFMTTAKPKEQLTGPIYMLDSVRIAEDNLRKYNPNDIALLTVYRGAEATRLAGTQGANGIVYIELKPFARNRYWRFFAGKSVAYLRAVPTPKDDSSILYILNGKVLPTNYEGDLVGIDDTSFTSLRIISKKQVVKEYGITSKSLGVVITTTAKPTRATTK